MKYNTAQDQTIHNRGKIGGQEACEGEVLRVLWKGMWHHDKSWDRGIGYTQLEYDLDELTAMLLYSPFWVELAKNIHHNIMISYFLLHTPVVHNHTPWQATVTHLCKGAGATGVQYTYIANKSITLP